MSSRLRRAGLAVLAAVLATGTMYGLARTASADVTPRLSGPQLVADGGDHLVEAEPPGDQDAHAPSLSRKIAAATSHRR